MTNELSRPSLVPELYVADIGASRAFYVGVLGFEVLYERPEDGFLYVARQGAELMLESGEIGRKWLTGALERPYGRGINFEIATDDVDDLYDRVRARGATIFLEMETQWYRRRDVELGVRQFIVQDPDGYLLRFSKAAAERPVA